MTKPPRVEQRISFLSNFAIKRLLDVPLLIAVTVASKTKYAFGTIHDPKQMLLRRLGIAPGKQLRCHC